MRKILERLAKEKSAPGSEEQKIGDFYASCMDEAAVEKLGALPMRPSLDRIAALTAELSRDRELAPARRLRVTRLMDNAEASPQTPAPM